MSNETNNITAKEAKDAQEWAAAVTNLPVRRIPSHTYYQGGICRRHPGGLFHCNGDVFGTYYAPAGHNRFLGVSLPSGSVPVPPEDCEIRFDFDSGVREVWACGELVSSRSVTAGEG